MTRGAENSRIWNGMWIWGWEGQIQKFFPITYDIGRTSRQLFSKKGRLNFQQEIFRIDTRKYNGYKYCEKKNVETSSLKV